MLTPSYIGSELTCKGVCEQAEHVMSPQGIRRMMKTQTNQPMLHTKPLNGVSIRKNVSCGSFYNMKAEKCTTLIHESSAFQLFIFHIFHFQFSFQINECTRTSNL